MAFVRARTTTHRTGRLQGYIPYDANPRGDQYLWPDKRIAIFVDAQKKAGMLIKQSKDGKLTTITNPKTHKSNYVLKGLGDVTCSIDPITGGRVCNSAVAPAAPPSILPITPAPAPSPIFLGPPVPAPQCPPCPPCNPTITVPNPQLSLTVPFDSGSSPRQMMLARAAALRFARKLPMNGLGDWYDAFQNYENTVDSPGKSTSKTAAVLNAAATTANALLAAKNQNSAAGQTPERSDTPPGPLGVPKMVWYAGAGMVGLGLLVAAARGKR